MIWKKEVFLLDYILKKISKFELNKLTNYLLQVDKF